MKTCYVCGGVCEKTVVHGPYIYWTCADCSTAQVLPQPTESHLRDYYDTFHLDASCGGVYDEVEERMQADFPAKLQCLIRRGSLKGGRLLDVGCGKGFFVKAAMAHGFSAEGIDISRSGVDYAQNVLGVSARAGRIEDCASSEWRESFDAATLMATIEHLVDPLKTLQVIRHSLKPGGVLLCDTGLGDVFWERFLPGHSQWYDAPQHMFVFSREGLSLLLEKAGFEVLHTDSNFDRTLLRRVVRWTRHVALCVGSGLLLGGLLGRRGFRKAREEAKWPLGRLVLIVARRREGEEACPDA